MATNGRTHQEILDQSTVPTAIAKSLAQFANVEGDRAVAGFGSILRSMTPKLRTRTALPSQTTHVEELPGRVFGVTDEAGAVNIPVVYAGAPGVGEVRVTYSTTEPVGVPTLEFQAAVTGYQIEKAEMPLGFDEVFDIIGN